MLIPVFQDEIVALDEDRALEHLVRQRFKPLQGIRGIREDKVEPLPADGQEIEDVVTHHHDVAETEATRREPTVAGEKGAAVFTAAYEKALDLERAAGRALDDRE